MFDTKIIYSDPYYWVTHFNFHGIYNYAKSFFKSEKVASFIEVTSDSWYNHSFKIHKFFLPELVWFLRNINNDQAKYLCKLIYQNTWYKDVYAYEHGRIPLLGDMSRIDKEMNVTLNSYQTDFIKSYSRKQVYELRGYLLAFEQGLGKTITSLALMTALKKKCVVIIAPKKTLMNVWKYHIDTFYKNKKKVWIAGFDESDPVDCDYYIVNYESMAKLFNLSISRDCGIIVDESHNFLHIQSNRSQNLIHLSKKLRCDDVLLMSGTPLKALGREMIPMLSVLDKRFDDAARDIFVRSFGTNSQKANTLFNNRLGLIMYRKLKDEVLDLPVKHEIKRFVKIPNSQQYTIDSVKEQVKEYIEERTQYHRKNKQKYDEMFDNIIEYLKTTKLARTDDFKEYLRVVTILRNGKEIDDTDLIHWSVEYENKVIIPILPNNMKKDFRFCKAAVKYLNLKIMGEVIGGLLVKLRDKMCQDMITHGKLDTIAEEAAKKTILFTSYSNCIKLATQYFEKKGYHPVEICGSTSKPENNINKFRNESEVNPLIASIQTLSTGVTLTEANTIIFLNKPWRYIEYQQASDRIHRIGQDTEVYIYTLILDTGSKPNLSTRMEEIECWSRDMFKQIIDNM